MISLFIDTSSGDVSIAVVKDGVILGFKTGNAKNMHSVYTTSFLDLVLKEAGIVSSDVDQIMVVNGPGSFTGVRIGVTIAKVFAYLLDLDVICVSSLKMRAISIEHNYCMSLIDAHHGNYYMGLYDKDNDDMLEEGFVSEDVVMDLIEKYDPVIVGDEEMVVLNTSVSKGILDVIRIVDFYKDSVPVNCHLLVPNYLKLPQALENLND